MNKPIKRRAHAAAIPETEEIDMPFAEGAHDELNADLRHRLISEAAYHLYAQRGYSDGYDLDDWLEAESEVDHVLLEHEQDAAPEPRARARASTR